MKTDNDNLKPPAMQDDSRFFRKLDWSAFWTALAISFVVYLYTLAPTLSLEDSGELAVAADHLGVPHPPGYPIWTMTCWLFTKIFAFVSFRGQPNPAWSIGLVSAVFGALATGMSAMLICRSGSDLVPEWHHSKDKDQSTLKTKDIICWIGGVVSSLLFAFTPAMWSQAVIVEVYTLNAFFLVLIFLLTYRWMCQPSNHLLFVTAFVFGLGLTNYQVLLLAALPLVIVILLKDTELLRDFIITGVPLVILFMYNDGKLVLSMKEGLLAALTDGNQALSRPLTALYLTINAVVLTLSYFLLPRGKTVAPTILFAELGVAFYIYMPIVSDLRNPPMNWGYPRTWEGFKHAITRGQYEAINPTDVVSLHFVDQIIFYLQDLRMQFTLITAILASIPFTSWRIKIGREINALFVGVALVGAGFASAMVAKFILPHSPIFVMLYKFIFILVMIIMAIGVICILINQVKEMFKKMMDHTTGLSSRVVVAGALAGGVLAIAYAIYQVTTKMRVITEPLRKANTNISPEAYTDIIQQVLGMFMLIIIPIILVGLLAWMMKSKYFQLRTTLTDNSQKWFIATLTGFLVMSVLMVVLANPKGDIQDNFIQKVKFISSHAIYSFWIGYGLIFGLAFVDKIFNGNNTMKYLSCGVAMCFILIPIDQNYNNKELLKIYGGAEQNGHDFGWQFGNYQLRGADSIFEELEPDEEPLPNPEFPPEMGPDAVFYGGTDPGRFVPTYMIYSADVRPDVYLITQNALADNTYMSVMRDLYGNDIWIPAQPDSAIAFRTYVEEVRSGKRPQNAQLKIEGGRVQVQGALGVMEINGILAEMIFEHNKFRHNFYVEESYVIQWMYPYLSPHGLIMKINNNKSNIPKENITDDLDFWDWYTRRLAGDEKFTRDVVARKSFSKLRSAIGGLYTSRRRTYEAEEAFQEARILYPLSPEANFRLAQEVMLPQKRLDDARDLIETFGRMDPGNAKVKDFLRTLDSLEKANKRIKQLEAVMKTGKLDFQKGLELASLYLNTRDQQRFNNLIAGIMNNPQLPPQVCFSVGQLLHKARNFTEMDKALKRCLKTLPANADTKILLTMRSMYADAQQLDNMCLVMQKFVTANPNDWKGWLDLASMQMGLKRTNDASRSAEHAVRLGGNQALEHIRKDQRFGELRDKFLLKQNNLKGLPGVGPRR